MSRTLFVALCLLLLVACDEPTDPGDAGSTTDAGTASGTDAATSTDAGAADAGPAVTDAGSDAGPLAQGYYFATDGDDSGDCAMAAPCQTLARAAELALSRLSAETDSVLHFAPGNYGVLDLELAGDALRQITWTSGQEESARFERLDVSCAAGQERCAAHQVFDGIDFIRGPGLDGASIARIEASDVTLRDGELWNEQVYDGEGISIPGQQRVLIESMRITRVIHAIRYSGSGHVFRGNEIFGHAGSAISMFCGGHMGRPQSAWDILIEGNRIHDHTPDYPDEPNYDRYDEPAELHASVFAVRGSDVTIRGNHVWNQSTETRNLALYDGDCGVAEYELGDILIEDNVAAVGGVFLSTGANPGLVTGTLIARHNTIIGHLTAVLSPGYDGDGCVFEDNLVTGNLAMVTRIYQDHDEPDARWAVEYNLADRSSHPAGSSDPSNTLLSALARDGAIADDYAMTSLFVSWGSVAEDCAPFGDADCDWSPAPGSLACTAARDGGYVGAIACE